MNPLCTKKIKQKKNLPKHQKRGTPRSRRGTGFRWWRKQPSGWLAGVMPGAVLLLDLLRGKRVPRTRARQFSVGRNLAQYHRHGSLCVPRRLPAPACTLGLAREWTQPRPGKMEREMGRRGRHPRLGCLVDFNQIRNSWRGGGRSRRDRRRLAGLDSFYPLPLFERSLSCFHAIRRTVPRGQKTPTITNLGVLISGVWLYPQPVRPLTGVDEPVPVPASEPPVVPYPWWLRPHAGRGRGACLGGTEDWFFANSV